VVAEAQKEMLSEVLDSTLATKSDINQLETLLTTDIHRLEKQIVVLKWMTGLMPAAVVSLNMKAFFVS